MTTIVVVFYLFFFPDIYPPFFWSIVPFLAWAHAPETPQSQLLLSVAKASPVDGKLIEADRLKMCGMMWPKEHETCLPMDAVQSATRDPTWQLHGTHLHLTKDFNYLFPSSFDSLQAEHICFPHPLTPPVPLKLLLFKCVRNHVVCVDENYFFNNRELFLFSFFSILKCNKLLKLFILICCCFLSNGLQKKRMRHSSMVHFTAERVTVL